MRTTWPVVGRLGADPSRLCLELVKPERCPDRDLLLAITPSTASAAPRSRWTTSPAARTPSPASSSLSPDIAKIDTALTSGIQHSPAAARW